MLPGVKWWPSCGPSGCGNTTLLNCLSGLDEIDSGSISIGVVRSGAHDSDNEKTRYRRALAVGGYVFAVLINLLPKVSTRCYERGDAAAGVPHQGGPS